MSTPSPRSGSSWSNGIDLATDTWTFSAQWATRHDGLPRYAERLRECLTGLAGLDPSLAHWFRHDEPVALDVAPLQELLEQGRNQEDPFGELGSTTVLWNGLEDDSTVARITALCNTRAGYLRDQLTLELPSPAGAPNLYRTERMVELFETMISAWLPQWCSVTPRSLADALYDEDHINVLGTWISYLDPSVHTRTGEPPAGVTALASKRGPGEIFVLAPEAAQVSVETVGRLRERITFAAPWSRLA